MTKERFIELLQKMSEDAFFDLLDGITEITFESGWTMENKDDAFGKLTQEAWDFCHERG